jgi:arginine decarboxylase
MPQDKRQPDWTVDQIRQTYNLAGWSGGYFGINAEGHAIAQSPSHPDHPGVDLFGLTEEIKALGLSLPVLVRFQHILRDRLDQLCEAFGHAMDECGYRGRYTAVYPIKVNQQRSVVEQLLRHGGKRVGLEAGSKPELMAVIGMSEPGGVIVCNGYKDREYIRLAMLAQKLGHRVYIVIEKPSELETVLREAAGFDVEPLLGVRVRLATLGNGKWQNTGGDRAKFGLSAAQTESLLGRLREEGRLGWLKLLHFHMGSQLTRLSDIEHGLREAVRYFIELQRLGAPLEIVDAGGGLGIDYEGTGTQAFCSMNYSLRDYARSVVEGIKAACDAQGLAHPEIFTEAGRAMTAHHAVLLTNVIDAEYAPDHDPGDEGEHDAGSAPLWKLWRRAADREPAETYAEAANELRELHLRYVRGDLMLAERARGEQLFFALCRKLLQRAEAQGPRVIELANALRERLADKYFCNFSVFQSVPDVWAFNQIFPIMPLHRLNEAPLRRVIIQDLTCDSDGQIKSYVDGGGVEPSLPAHRYRPGEDYLLGIFLVGAYQEILGDMHNLFGDTHAINVELTDDGGHRLEEPEPGDRIDELLRFVHYDPDTLFASVRAKLARTDLSPGVRARMERELDEGLRGYTYLED